LNSHSQIAGTFLCLLVCVFLHGCKDPAPQNSAEKASPTASESTAQESAGEEVQKDDSESKKEIRIRQMRVAWRDLVKIYGKELPPAAVNRSRQEARAQLDKAREELGQGRDWNEVAARYSDTAPVVGGIALTRDGAVAKPLKDAAFGLAVGEMVLVETAFGWHLIERLP